MNANIQKFENFGSVSYPRTFKELLVEIVQELYTFSLPVNQGGQSERGLKRIEEIREVLRNNKNRLTPYQIETYGV